MEVDAWYTIAIAVLSFICVSSAVYIANDIKDIDEDRVHPVKCLRPLAAGEVSENTALWLVIVLLGAASGMLSLLPLSCSLLAALYIWLNLLYTIWLKHIAILDVFFIASCYVLRVLMGCFALSVNVSPWIILTTFLLAMFIGFGKRFHEMSLPEYVRVKPNLQHYSVELLDKLVSISAGAALITYAIYTTEISRQIGSPEMVYTTGFVAFGLFRYLQAIHVYHQGGEPESVVLGDRMQLVNIVLWLATTLLILF
jgi:4-hydroxybenzoate polyprenyltransferase